MPRFDVAKVDGRTTLWVDSDRLDESVDYFCRHGIDALGINPVRGYKLGNIEFLRKHPYVTKLHIVFPPAFQFEMSPVLALSGLQSLTVSGPIELPLNQFSQLTEFRGVWGAGLQLSGCEKLRTLYLIGYRSVSGNLKEFPELPELRDLSLVQSPVKSLAGISRFHHLKRLELAYLSKLESLEEITAISSLEVLDVYKCRKLKGHADVRLLSNLRILKFNDCGTIPSLDFIDDMPQLEEFRFVNTNIQDGNLEPLLRLKRVGFLPKKHYSHKPEEIEAILRAKGEDAI